MGDIETYGEYLRRMGIVQPMPSGRGRRRTIIIDEGMQVALPGGTGNGGFPREVADALVVGGLNIGLEEILQPSNRKGSLWQRGTAAAGAEAFANLVVQQTEAKPSWLTPFLSAVIYTSLTSGIDSKPAVQRFLLQLSASEAKMAPLPLFLA